MTDAPAYDRERRRRAIWISLYPGNYDTGGAPTTTTLAVTPASPQISGTTLTMTATISAGTGTVTFYDGASQLGSPVALSGLTAVLSWSSLSVSSHNLTARYNGDSTHASSTSAIVPYTINAGGLDADTTAWVTAVTGAGGSVSGTQQSRVDALIVGLKADGVWANIDRIWLYAGESSPQQAARSLKVPTAPHTLVSAPTLSAAGYHGNGTSSYINTNFTPSVDGVGWSSSNIFFGQYIQSRTGNQDWEIFGTQTTVAVQFFPLASFLPGKCAWAARTAAFTSNITQADAKGFYVIVSVASTQALYKNGNTTPFDSDTQGGSADMAAIPQFILAANNGGSPVNFSGDTISAHVVGGVSGSFLSAAQASALAARINTYMTAWGVNVY